MSNNNNESTQAAAARTPNGNLLLRTLAMPGDTNPAGDIFGGWIMSRLDISGALLAQEIAGGRVVTVAVDGLTFLKPVNVGDVVCCYGYCTHVGHTSLKIKLEIWVKKLVEENGHEKALRNLVTEANIVYVAVNKEGRPRPLPADAAIIAKYGIDAAQAGLNPDGTLKTPACGL